MDTEAVLAWPWNNKKQPAKFAEKKKKRYGYFRLTFTMKLNKAFHSRNALNAAISKTAS